MDALEQLIARVQSQPLKPGMFFRVYLLNLMPMIDQVLDAGYTRRTIWEALRDHARYDKTLRAFYAIFERVTAEQRDGPPRKATVAQTPPPLGSHPLAALERAVSAAVEAEPPPMTTARANIRATTRDAAQAAGLSVPVAVPVAVPPSVMPSAAPLATPSATREPPRATGLSASALASTSLPGMPAVIKPSRLPHALERIEAGLDPLDDDESAEANDIRSRHARTVDEFFSPTVSNPLLGKK